VDRLGARRAGGIWLVGAAVYLVCEAVAAASLADYSYLTDYVSDLGVSAAMNVGAFMLHGSLLLLGAIVFVRACPTPGRLGWAFVLAAAVNATGNVLVGTFGSGNGWHVIGAGMAIVGGNVAVIVAGIGSRRIGAPRAYRLASIVLGVVGLACLLTLIIDGSDGSLVLPVGLVERGSVYPIIAWEIMTGLVVLRRR
jgi:hypothetical membrane protein